MHQVKIIKGTSSKTLQDRVNETLENLDGEFIDIKVSGASSGQEEKFLAVIIYKK
ncbi:sporulation protein Cse60 [Bacillus suaedae]|uniref:Sporulation protein Cse60 n=1 Tax=Halalkalibacter suaedae TaxID=2822140 RepID=A0A940WYB8_9BACI|nr:sporulation protein Cse60 [Bacillus suaedae]MBP3952953.1 sporulation protein Cse60 [Bacillus suaedae]